MRQGQGSTKNRWGKRPITGATVVACVNPPHTDLEQVQGNKKGRRRPGCARDRGSAVERRDSARAETDLSKLQESDIAHISSSWSVLAPAKQLPSVAAGRLFAGRENQQRAHFPRLHPDIVSVLVQHSAIAGRPKRHDDIITSLCDHGRPIFHLQVKPGVDGNTTGPDSANALPRFATSRRNTRTLPVPDDKDLRDLGGIDAPDPDTTALRDGLLIRSTDLCHPSIPPLLRPHARTHALGELARLVGVAGLSPGLAESSQLATVGRATS